jgi:S1-C subfamily serine protease
VTGSGIIFGVANDRLYIVTAKHVVRQSGQITGLKVSIKSLPGESLDAELADQSSSELDMAVVVVRDVQKYKIPVETIPFDRLGKPQSLQANEKVYALGLPGERKDETLQADEFMETAVPKVLFRSKTVRPGYSGGALFNSNWQLVGMIRADDPPFAHALIIDQVLTKLREWRYPVNLTLATDKPVR